MWLNTREAAAYMRLPLRSFERVCKGIPRYRVGRRYIYARDDLDAWIVSNRV